LISLDSVSLAIAAHGYAALFLATLVEGPIATVIGAFLASQGLLDLAAVYAVAVAGDLAGDLLLYAIGRAEWVPQRLRRMGYAGRVQRWLGASRGRLCAHAGRMLVFGKLTHAAGFLVLLAAGAARVPILPFVGYNLLGTLPKSAIFLLLGFFLGASYHRIDTYLWIASCVALLLVCVVVAVYVRRRAASDPPGA
jgi:membrane protein DedA with SNARE-associated domain